MLPISLGIRIVELNQYSQAQLSVSFAANLSFNFKDIYAGFKYEILVIHQKKVSVSAITALAMPYCGSMNNLQGYLGCMFNLKMFSKYPNSLSAVFLAILSIVFINIFTYLTQFEHQRDRKNCQNMNKKRNIKNFH